jgi:uncharacterized protein DUF6895
MDFEGGEAVARDGSDTVSSVRPLVLTKTVAEAAMLLRCAHFLVDEDDRVATAVESVVEQLIPHARNDGVLSALCRDPANAFEHATAHIHLTALGYNDGSLDRLLAEIAQGDDLRPERLPNHDLEDGWLRQIWSGGDGSSLAELVARTCLARPLDALACTAPDLYGFTHTVLYATDMGSWPLATPRQVGDIEADAEGGLAAALDADNFDLAAELLWIWPLLRLPWSPIATFSFGILAAMQDSHGFLPGPDYSSRQHMSTREDQRGEYILRTSYHATLVMGILCSAALRSNLVPPTTVPRTSSGRRADSIISLLRTKSCKPRWQSASVKLEPAQHRSLAEFMLSVALRRARAANDLTLLRQCLSVALQHDLIETPAARQAVALLRRSTILGQISTFAL